MTGTGMPETRSPPPGVVLLAGADDEAAQRLAELPQPFTTSEARAISAAGDRQSVV